MKANIPQEYEDAIYDYIHIELMIEVMEKKQRDGLKVDLVNDKLIKEHTKVKKYMRKHNIKVYPGEIVNIDFVEYKYSVKVDGGYKEGANRYWKHAMKMQMNRRLAKLRNKESILTREYE